MTTGRINQIAKPTCEPTPDEFSRHPLSAGKLALGRRAKDPDETKGFHHRFAFVALTPCVLTISPTGGLAVSVWPRNNEVILADEIASVCVCQGSCEVERERNPK